MKNLNLSQLKSDDKNSSVSRLNLDQFKSQISKNVNHEELEKLTGGILGACHTTSSTMTKTDSAAVKYLKETVNDILGRMGF